MSPRLSINARAHCLTALLMLSSACAVFGQVELQPEFFSTPDARPTVTNLPPQQPLPNTGRVTHNYSKEPDSYVIIQPLDPTENLFLRFENPESRKLVASMFIRAGAAFSISNQMVLPGDDYIVKVASGTNWYGVDAAFGPTGIYSVMRPTIKLEPYTRHHLRIKSSHKGGLRQEGVPWQQFQETAASTNRSVGSKGKPEN